jgi:hypothetical protein
MAPHLRPYAALALRLLCLGPVTASSVACQHHESKIELRELHVAESRGHFLREGFVEMVPPLRLPRRKPQQLAEVWLKLPSGAKLQTSLVEGRPLLRLPAGTEAARVEKQQAGQADERDWRVADVRGTRFGSADAETFFVLRPVDTSAEPALSGWEWQRGLAREQREATRLLADLAASIVPRQRAESERRSIERTNDCAGCHVHARLENHLPSEHGVANRGADASGCYQIQSVLLSQLPLETYFPLEQNLGDPFIHFGCREGAELLRTPDARPRCADGSVPWGRFDVRAALAASSERAERLCASRRYLAEHLDQTGLAVFREGLDECGIEPSSVTATLRAP